MTSPDSSGARGVAVRRLTLTQFRCYASARLELDARPVALTGPNGAGKTNVLEAVSLLTPGRGLRRAKLAELVRRDAPPPALWGVAAQVDGLEGLVEIGTGRDPQAGEESERRVVRIDGQPARGQAALAEHVAMVWLTPQMDRLFLEGASNRRRFLDRLVFGFDPGHAARMSAYEQAMRERARLLKEGRRDPAWLGALEETMAANGVAAAAARVDVVARLREACALGVGPFPQAGLELDGAVERALLTAPALAVEDEVKARLQASRRLDAETGGAAEGPHKTDLAVRHLAKDMPAAQCSTGEQKALLIAIVLANARLMAAERGKPPLMLLDEVAAHLDAGRRAALYDEILALGAQAWLTGTDAAMFAALDGAAQHFHVRDAAIAPWGGET